MAEIKSYKCDVCGKRVDSDVTYARPSGWRSIWSTSRDHESTDYNADVCSNECHARALELARDKISIPRKDVNKVLAEKLTARDLTIASLQDSINTLQAQNREHVEREGSLTYSISKLQEELRKVYEKQNVERRANEQAGRIIGDVLEGKKS